MSGQSGHKTWRRLGWTAFAGAVLLFVIALWPLRSHPGTGTPSNQALSDVKQQSLAILMYATDHDDRLPPAETWMDVTSPYVKNDDIFRDSVLEEPAKTDFGFAYYEPLSYASHRDIQDVATTPLTFQSSDLSWNAHGYLDLLPGRLEHGENVVSFADGHAKAMPRSWRFDVIVIRRGHSDD